MNSKKTVVITQETKNVLFLIGFLKFCKIIKTDVEFCKIVGYNFHNIPQIKSEERNFPPGKYENIYSAFGVSATWFKSNTGPVFTRTSPWYSYNEIMKDFKFDKNFAPQPILAPNITAKLDTIVELLVELLSKVDHKSTAEVSSYVDKRLKHHTEKYL